MRVFHIYIFLPTVAFSQLSSNMCCSRDRVSRHNGGASGAPLKPLKDDSALRALSTLRGLRGAPEVPPLCRETQSLGQQMLELSCENATVGRNGLNGVFPIHTNSQRKKHHLSYSITLVIN